MAGRVRASRRARLLPLIHGGNVVDDLEIEDLRQVLAEAGFDVAELADTDAAVRMSATGAA